jgi:hypothetical protein
MRAAVSAIVAGILVLLAAISLTRGLGIWDFGWPSSVNGYKAWTGWALFTLLVLGALVWWNDRRKRND